MISYRPEIGTVQVSVSREGAAIANQRVMKLMRQALCIVATSETPLHSLKE
jgi:hypothetical protein